MLDDTQEGRTMKISERLHPYIRAALDAGLTVYAVNPSSEIDARRPKGYAYVCQDPGGSFCTVEVPTMALDPVELHAPIKPSREYGSSVLVDHDGTPEDAVRAIRAVCESATVAVRFMPRHMGTPIVPNAGRAAIDGWRSGVTEVTMENLEG